MDLGGGQFFMNEVPLYCKHGGHVCTPAEAACAQDPERGYAQQEVRRKCPDVIPRLTLPTLGAQEWKVLNLLLARREQARGAR